MHVFECFVILIDPFDLLELVGKQKLRPQGHIKLTFQPCSFKEGIV